MKIHLLSLFPNYFKGPFDESIIARARKRGLVDIEMIDIRDFTEDGRADDRPFGGGPGMVMMAEPIVKAIRSVKTEHSKVIYLSPQGKTLDDSKCRQLAQEKHLVFLCGHYEGIDERAFIEIDEELSIGDYILTNGCLAAIVVIDAALRYIPGVVGDERAPFEDSFGNGIFDHPHWTKPREFEGMKVPAELLNGDHKKIQALRYKMACKKTESVRPDLLKT